MTFDQYLAIMNGLPPVMERLPVVTGPYNRSPYSSVARLQRLILALVCLKAGMHMFEASMPALRQTLLATAQCAGAAAGKLRNAVMVMVSN